MADPTITGNFGGENFQFTLNGVSTQKQMDRLIELTQAMAKKAGANTGTANKANKELEDHLDNLKELNKQETKQVKQNKDTGKAWEELLSTTGKLKYGWQSAIKDLGGWQTAITSATGFLIGSLTGYADSLSGALKMGVSGSLMDFAVASKTAGVSMGTFTKALAETGGGFASLGTGATDGAKYFGSLVSSVRSATASVGNLGMTNEELAMFTAQQTKVAISQGFKGKAAQDAVIRNSQSLGKELDDLANRTGKNVLEMAAAAAKLASDPIVATFVKSAQAGSQKVSESINSLTAGLTAQFGAKGGKIAEDLVKSSLGGLPFAVTQTGKNMILSSQATYNELERQAAKAKRGDKITEEDRKRLNDTVLQEVAARGDQLRMMAQFEGPAGESARQILEMATEAEFYNSEEGRKRREQDKSAQQFNASIRQFQANLQALAIPFLNLINGINWTFFIDVISGAIKVLEILLTPLTLLGKIIGDTGVGTVIGGLGALALIFLQGKAAFSFLIETVKKLSDSILKVVSSTSLGNKLGIGVEKTGIGGLANKEKELESLRQAAEEQRKARVAEFYKQFRNDGSGRTAEEAKRAAETAAAYSPKATVGEKLAKLSPLVEKFAGVITGATAALAGSALAIWGESRLREDENDWLGQLLVTGGKTLEFLGTFGGLLFQFGGSILSFVSTTFPVFTATITAWASTAWASITSFAATTMATMTAWASTAWASISAFSARMMVSAAGLIPALAGLAVAAWTAAAPFLPLIAAVTAVAGVAYLIYDNWSAIVDAGKALYDWIANAATKIWDFITSPFKMLIDWFKNSWLGKMFGGGDTKTSATSTSLGKTSSINSSAVDDAIYNQAKAAGATGSTSYQSFSGANAKDQAFGKVKDLNTSGYSKELVNTQTNAIDQNRLKESETNSLQRKQIALLEDISGTNSAQLGVQSRTAGNQDNSTRYLKTISMNGPAA